jgi:hypothetical protein
MRDPYLQKIEQQTEISHGTLLGALQGAAQRTETRFTAQAVVRAPDALPVADILRSVSPPEQELLRLVLLAPEAHDHVLDAIGADRFPSQVGRELFRAVAEARARDDRGVRPPFALSQILDGLDEETRALGQALLSRSGPDLRLLSDHSLSVAIEQSILDLEEGEWLERSDFNRDSTAEAEREGDSVTVDRLMLERRLLNEQRRSLDKRRDQTRLLARPSAVAAG